MLVNCHLLREEPYGKVKGGFILYFFFPNERYGGNYYSFHLYSLKIKSNSRGRKWAPKIRTESQEKQLGSIRDFFGFLKYSPARPSKRVISSLTPVSDSSTNSSWKWPTWEWCLCLWGTHLGNCLLCFSFLLALTLGSFWHRRGEVGTSVYEMPAGIKSMYSYWFHLVPQRAGIFRRRQQGGEEGAAPTAAPLPSSWGGMDAACKSCSAAAAFYQIKACAVISDAKVMPRSSYGL